ncbi:hypothetical protein [Sphingomonas oligophenolica]|uniref:Uncharacterized protein n=1 Tax=Sphingomonas oligophenolica TaxID=301154 RepID=A0A502CE03_9SPHN|nr:hypothetical protein [Sphingomonas oligophenolica]TPG10910.1 hypothetical protein EAH84_11535 [Sphingomonas oligophenolica]
MIRAFFRSWLGAFRDGWELARVLPLIVLAMMGIEFAQHLVELHLGFFSADAAVRKAASLQPLRMAFGWPKMLVLWAIGLVTIRYCVSGDARSAIRPSTVAMRRYGWVVLFQFIPFTAILYAGPILATVGLPASGLLAFRSVFGLGQQLLEPLLMLWFVNAALGSNGYGPAGSARTTGWLYFWALPLMFVTRVPLGLLHQLLNTWPAGREPIMQWGLLLIDALVVGALAVVLPAVQVRIARFIAERRGMGLLGNGAGE